MLFANALLLSSTFFSYGENAPSSASVSSAFKVQDFRGVWHESSRLADRGPYVIFFTGVECPLAASYTDRLVQLAGEYSRKGVGFLALDPNSQDSIEDLVNFAKKHALSFPLCKDVGNSLADRWKVTRTPEVLLFSKEGRLLYRGKIDDQFGMGYHRPAPTKKYLVNAIDAVLGGKSVENSATDVEGCYIGRAKQQKAGASTEVTFSKEISRLFQKRCNECHRPGKIAPFSLTSYSEAAGWAEAALEMAESRRMPPWHASPKFGHFSNDARLSDQEIALLKAWVNAGAPEGDPRDLPAPVVYTEGWRIPKPDAVFELPAVVKVPATGDVAYKYFEVDAGFKEDRWVRAAEAQPGNPSVVHHIIVFIRTPDAAGGPGHAAVSGLNDDWLVATAPGARPLDLPPGQAKKIPKGSKLIFQMHYTPNGVAQTDRSRVGLVFADPKTVTRRVSTGRAVNTRFTLQPNKSSQVVEASQRIDDDTLLLSFFPHMHLRGQAFRYELRSPNGDRETLLDIPHYDFAWQNTYTLAEPKLLPAGSVLHCTAWYDNSSQNRSNPNPNSRVHWGDQTYEEMMIGYFLGTPAEADAAHVRMDRFHKVLAAGELKASTQVSDAARQIRKPTPESLDRLDAALKPLLPQIDRIDVMTVSKSNIEVLAATTRGGGPLRRLTKVPIVNMQLRMGRLGDKAKIPEAVASDKITVVSLAEASGWDYKALQKSYATCLHAPLTINGQKAIVTFWSKEPNAFPPEAAAFLERIVELAKESK